ncbi:hypothetical protein [Nocardia yunnanensis]|uniref:hypothetical protein n=1 Tax=Nocardia yunnanensis TaxID=2382165 RepID=UPI0013C42605|nr:hypothetical protein [Nocardia yunnanensis]
MSRTKFVDIDHRGFRVLDDALDVWLAYLVEETGEVARTEAWLGDLAGSCRSSAADEWGDQISHALGGEIISS